MRRGGAGGLWPPEWQRVQGRALLSVARKRHMASWLDACGKQLAARGVADARAAARGGDSAAGSVTPAAPRRSPRPGSAGRRAGGALRKRSPSPGATCRGWGEAQADEGPRPTTIRGPGAEEHRRGDRARSQQTAQGCPAGAPPQAAAALRRGMVRATAGARPAAAVAAVWKEGGACADPRATEAKRPQGAEQARRPAAQGGKGRPVGPRGAGGCHWAAGGTPATSRCHATKKEGQPLRAGPLLK